MTHYDSSAPELVPYMKRLQTLVCKDPSIEHSTRQATSFVMRAAMVRLRVPPHHHGHAAPTATPPTAISPCAHSREITKCISGFVFGWLYSGRPKLQCCSGTAVPPPAGRGRRAGPRGAGPAAAMRRVRGPSTDLPPRYNQVQDGPGRPEVELLWYSLVEWPW